MRVGTIVVGALFAGVSFGQPGPAGAWSRGGLESLPQLNPKTESRMVSPENPTGEKGKGAMAIPNPADPDLAFSDALSEWFPALTRNVSVAAVQGYEWLSDKSFATRLDEYNALQTCVNKSRACVEAWADKTGASFEYVLVSQNSQLSFSLSETPDYQVVYLKDNIFIYKRSI